MEELKIIFRTLIIIQNLSTLSCALHQMSLGEL